MKKVILILIFFAFPLLGWTQKVTSFSKTLQNEKYHTHKIYSTEMKIAAKALDDCSKNKCKLTDPIKNKKTVVKQQISVGGAQPNSIQKSMGDFEKELFGQHPELRDNLIKTAFIKYPGYSFLAISSRMHFYIQFMERIGKDE